MDNQAPNANAFMTQIVPVICNINIDSETFEFRWFVFQLHVAVLPKLQISRCNQKLWFHKKPVPTLLVPQPSLISPEPVE